MNPGDVVRQANALMSSSVAYDEALPEIERPKKPLSAYIAFMVGLGRLPLHHLLPPSRLTLPPSPRNCIHFSQLTQRKKFKAENTELSFNEINTTCSAMWANLPADEKKVGRRVQTPTRFSLLSTSLFY